MFQGLLGSGFSDPGFNKFLLRKEKRNMRTVRQHRRAVRRGLTLIELTLVVAILAILAGFLLPRLGLVRNLSADAGNADQTRAALDQSVLYNITQGHYPQGEDTLVEAGNVLYGSANGDTYGLDPSLSPLLTVFTTDNNSEKSINAQLTPDSSGATAATLYDNSQADATLNGAGNSEDPASAVTVSVGNHISLAEVTLPTEPVTATNASKTASIYAGTYNQSELNASTGAPLDGSYLLALGFGPASQLQGKTALGVPALFVKNPDSYNRPILLLRVYGGAYVPTAPFDNLVPVGTSAATAGALSPDGKLVAGNLSKYQTDQQR
jgi:prepilin-type N-terminal cleavage/methylation domain-containing protein